MNEMREIILDMTNRLLSDHCNQEAWEQLDEGSWPESIWGLLAEQGLTTVGVSEENGGVGLGFDDMMSIIRLTGYHACPAPLAEAIVANWLIDIAGNVPCSDKSTVALPPADAMPTYGANGTLCGHLKGVAWGSQVDTIVTLCVSETGEEMLAAFLPSKIASSPVDAANLANEPRSDISLEGDAPEWACPLPKSLTAHRLRAVGALLRASQMAGAMERAISFSLEYVNDRKQFGRPIGKFQAVQHMLAIAAEHYSASSVIANAASLTFGGEDFDFMAAIAKARAGEAVQVISDSVHQSHGAIGFTHEYSLQFFTRRLWSWRDEFGNERQWQREVGRKVLDAGADGLWPMITSLGVK